MADTDAQAQVSAEPTPFWRFSLHFYRQSGVSDACIAVQDESGADVNLLLFLFWLAAAEQRLSVTEVNKLDDKVRAWRDLTIIPIRDVRRRLKGAATPVDPARQEAFRTKVKAIELDAERLQQEALFAFTQSGPLGEQAAPRDAARANVAAYEHVLNLRFAQPALAVLFGAFDTMPHGEFAGAAAAQRQRGK